MSERLTRLSSDIAEACRVRPLSPTDADAVEAFIVRHPLHGPGHRLALARLDAALGCTELSCVAELDGEVVGYAPARLVRARTLRVLPVASVSGGSLVACGPLVEPCLSESQRTVVLAALTAAVRERARREGAHWLRWVHQPVMGDRPALEALHPHPLLALGFELRLLPGLLVDLQHSEEILLAALNPTTRRRIRRAEREGLVSEPVEGAGAVEALRALREQADSAFGGHARAGEGFRALLSLLGAPSERDDSEAQAPDSGRSRPPLLHVLSVRRRMESQGAADAHSGGEVPERCANATLSAVVTCESNGLAYYFLSFNSDAGLLADANPVGLWRAMLSAKARGNRWFLLGSLEYGEGKSARISGFKRQFGGSVVLAPVAEWCARPLTVSAHRLAAGAVARIRGK